MYCLIFSVADNTPLENKTPNLTRIGSSTAEGMMISLTRVQRTVSKRSLTIRHHNLSQQLETCWQVKNTMKNQKRKNYQV